MALKTFKPVTPGLRQLVIVDRSELYKGKPVKALTEGKSGSGGRNNLGRVTVRFRGGGHKRTLRNVDFKRRARLGEIRCPTLVVVAADDALTPPFYSEELAARIPGAKLAVLPTGGHFVPILQPEEYNAAVGGFLRAHAAR